MKVHPLADMFPMMSDEELDELAADIKENGLLNPIVRNKEGILIDGRNRLEACKRAGVIPKFETLNGTDPVAYILAQNISRRHLNKGQQAMAVAFAYPEPEKGGRGKKKTMEISSTFSEKRLQQARQVLGHSRELAQAVLSDIIKLDAALEKVIAERKAIKTTEEKLAQLREDAPDLADLVAEERLQLPEAYASFEQRKRDAEEKEKSQRETICRVAEDSYRTVIAWAVEDFCKDVIQHLDDEEFREIFIKRVRLDETEIPNIVNGAKALTEILNNL
jgi:hypothetical protein